MAWSLMQFFRSKPNLAKVAASRPRRCKPSRFGCLRVESLEDRSMMAGVVTVTTNALGDVSLRGDAANNHVELGAFGINNALVITGFDGTQILLNGVSSTVHVLVPIAVPRDLRVDLGAGSDEFVNRQVSVGRDFFATLGTGSDYCQLLDFSVGRNVTMEGGGDAANDTLEMDQVTMGGNLTANFGPAATTVFDHFELTNSTIHGNALVTNTTNSALFTAAGTTIFGTLNVQTGAGVDLVQLGGHQRLKVLGNISVNLGSEGDYLLLDQLEAYSLTTIDMGTGNDVGTLDRASTFFGAVTINLGAGNDQWDFPTSTAKNSTFYSTMQILGGAGVDTVTHRLNAFYLKTATFSQIENLS